MVSRQRSARARELAKLGGHLGHRGQRFDWSALEARGTLNAHLVECLPDRHVAAVGASVPVAEGFAPGRPLAARDVLDAAGLRAAQRGGGARLFFPVFEFRVDDPVRSRRNFEALVDGVFTRHRGYRVRECLVEAFGPEERRFLESAGLRVRREGDPCLMGLTREEAQAAPGARFGRLFVEHPPRLGLRPVHRELLGRALMEETDEAIARALSVSTSAIKQRWASLYDHVERIAPGLARLLFGQEASFETRGAERRRHLVAYVREHPEELQPWIAPLRPPRSASIRSQNNT
jgi:hypothetical protein